MGLAELTFIGAIVVAVAVVGLFAIFLIVRSFGGQASSGLPIGPVSREACLWAMVLHFSVLLGFAAPLVGLIAPIVIWQLQRTRYPEIDVHGRIVVNGIISELIYVVVCFFLIFVLVGIPLLIILGVLGVIFPIVGGIKANYGEVWRYPLSIPFFG